MGVRNKILVLSVIVVILGLTIIPHAPLARAHTTVFKTFTVPANSHDVQLHFDTGVTPPLNNLRFIIAGDPAVTINSIVSTTGTTIIFNPPATPYDVTVQFVQNPTTSDSGDFIISANNGAAQDITIEIGVLTGN